MHKATRCDPTERPRSAIQIFQSRAKNKSARSYVPRSHCLGYMVRGVTIAQGSPAHSLFQSLSAFRQQWPGGGFSWDSRLFCVASSFSADLESDARSAVMQVFRFQWNSRAVRTAPEPIQEIAEVVGGLRSDQILVATEPNETLMAYGLWWPWGDDVTISFRIGLSGLSAARYEDDFRELYGVFAY